MIETESGLSWSKPANAGELRTAWDRYSIKRERRTFATTSLLIILLVPAWSAFDFYFEPELAPRFLIARLVDVVITIALWMMIARSDDLRRNRLAMCASVLAVGLTIAWMLPQVAQHYALYTFGFSLVFWGVGLIVIWPLRYVIPAFSTILAAHIIAYGATDFVSRGVFVGSLFYLGSAAVVSMAQLVVRRKLEHEAFLATYELEKRNAELASTQARLYGSSAALAETLDAEAIAARAVGIAVPAVATWAVLFGTGPNGRSLCAAAHADPALQPALAAAANVATAGRPSTSVATQPLAVATPSDVALATGAQIAAIVDGTAPLRGGAAGRAQVPAGGTRSLIVAPLVVRGERTGTLVLGWHARAFEPNELAFTEEVARRAALALDNARLFREAADAVQLRDDFISIASHELRTPLSALVLTVEAQLLTLPADDPQHRVFDKLDRLITRLSSLVSHLLDVSQLTAGRLVLDHQDTDLAAVLRDVADQLAETALHSGSTIEIDAPPHVHGRWDRPRLERVIANLIGNALKYGRGKPIQIRLEQAGERVQLAVSDHGIGIAAEDQVRIFERFERAVRERHVSGFGLGLWIARSIVEQHGGTIACASTLGNGATFTIDLPRVPA